MEITKQKARSLRMKMRNAELSLKGATVIYGFQALAAACSKTARTNVKVGKTSLLLPLVLLRAEERISEQLISRRVSIDTKLFKFTLLG